MARPGIDQEYRNRMKRLWVEQFGRWCAGWGIKGHTVSEGIPLHWDHIMPKSKGGSEYGPGQVLCKPCNESKHNISTQEVLDAMVGSKGIYKNPLAELEL